MMVGMPSPEQMPQQMLIPPQEMHRPSAMVIDVLGIRVPASMLESGYFWLFMAVCAAVVLGTAWLKYSKGTK